jgi:hypothetical protein
MLYLPFVEGVGQKSGPCTATFNDLLCFYISTIYQKFQWSIQVTYEWILRLILYLDKKDLRFVELHWLQVEK